MGILPRLLLHLQLLRAGQINRISDAACPLSTLDNKDGADTGTLYCSRCVMELATILPCDLTSWQRWEHHEGVTHFSLLSEKQ